MVLESFLSLTKEPYINLPYLDCPCGPNCLDGCDNCPNPVCECQVSTKKKIIIGLSILILKVVENNAEWLRCMDYNSSRLGKCIYECEEDKQCEDECVNSFKILQKDCPCEVGSCHAILFSKLVFRKIVKLVAHAMISTVSRQLLSPTKQLKLSQLHQQQFQRQLRQQLQRPLRQHQQNPLFLILFLW